MSVVGPWRATNLYGDHAAIEWSITGDEVDLFVIHPPEADQWEAIAIVQSFDGDRENPPEWDEKSLGLFDTRLDAMEAAETWLAEIDEAARLADEQVDQAMLGLNAFRKKSPPWEDPDSDPVGDIIEVAEQMRADYANS